MNDPQPAREAMLNQIIGNVVSLNKRQEAAIDRFTNLMDQLFGDNSKTAEKVPSEDFGPGKIGSLRSHLSEAYRHMDSIEILIEQLSDL